MVDVCPALQVLEHEYYFEWKNEIIKNSQKSLTPKKTSEKICMILVNAVPADDLAL